MSANDVTHYVGDDCAPDGHRGAPEHVHEVDKRNRVMLCGWCACGETWDERQGAWVGPKYFDGMRRRAQWRGDQGREG